MTKLTTIEQIIETGKKYQLIIADPPWSYHLWKVNVNTPPSKRKVRMASAYYNTMTTKDICELAVNQITDSNCALLLWVTSPLLPDGLKVMEAWGFKYKTIGVIWSKLTKNNKLKLGLGHYTRPCAEICLLGIKGRLEVKNHSIKQVIVEGFEELNPMCILFNHIMEHSTKPKIHFLAESLFGRTPGAMIELFARDSPYPNWDYFGDDIK